jgi:hypothetical protein
VYITGRRQESLDAAVKEIGSNVTAVQGVRICAGCALKAREIQSPEMETAAKPSSQPRTKSCVVSGNGHCEA